MDVQKYFEIALVGYLFFHVGADYFHFAKSALLAFGVVIRKKVTVHVATLGVRAVVANDNTIWINDGSYPELVLFSHLVSQDMLGAQKVQEAMYDER